VRIGCIQDDAIAMSAWRYGECIVVINDHILFFKNIHAVLG